MSSNNNNTPITMAEIENKGRALISTRPLIAGEIILRDSPLLLYGGAAANYCSHCFRSISPRSQSTVSCPNCPNHSIFCTHHCLSTAASSSHTPFVCRSLLRLFAADSPLLRHRHDRRLQARFLISAYNLSMTSPPDFQTLLSLQGDAFIDDASVFLHSLISSLFDSSNFVKLGFSVELTSALLAKDKVNTFGLMEPFVEGRERSVRGYGVYPRVSFFNHDCLPNACCFDYIDSTEGLGNTDFVVRAIHDVSEGREICLSYFPVNVRYSERQKRLKEIYGFVCGCERCKVEANWSDNEEEGEDEMDGDDDDDGMEEDEGDGGDDLETSDCGVDEENGDFPHQFFFVKYMCGRDECGGTLAPLPPVDGRPSAVMECNACGNLSKCED